MRIAHLKTARPSIRSKCRLAARPSAVSARREPPIGRVQQFRTRAIGTQRVGGQALLAGARSQQHRAGAVAEQRIDFHVATVENSRIAIGSDDQRQRLVPAATNCAAVTRA